MANVRVSRQLVLGISLLGVGACGEPGTGAEGAATDATNTGATTSASASDSASTSTTSTTVGSSTSTTSTSTNSSSSGGSATDTSTTGQPGCENFGEQVTAEAITKHLLQLQSHADAAGGNRVSGQPGYDASAQYVFDTLEALGYEVSFEEFEFQSFQENAPSELDAVTPAAVVYGKGADFEVAPRSGSGEVTTAVTAVDLDLGLGNNSTSGCQDGDFAGFPAGNIALVQRGSCTFSAKVARAEAAGASAIVIFNQGDTPARTSLFGGSLNPSASIPVLFASYGTGEEIAGDISGSYTLHILVDAETSMRPTRNVIAQSVAGDSAEVIMLGAHLDSVPAGAGMNDDGSGSAGLLVVAEILAACDPNKQVRFGWWGAEEWGLIGSEVYVDALAADELSDISMYLNFDMIGSVNHVYMIYDGDGSDEGPGGPAGSGALESLFSDYFDLLGLPSRPVGLVGSSDYEPFRQAGVAVGGMSTGWSEAKTQQEADVFGGQAGQAHDPCYHQLCDNIDNVDVDVMANVVRAMANAVELTAY